MNNKMANQLMIQIPYLLEITYILNIALYVHIVLDYNERNRDYVGILTFSINSVILWCNKFGKSFKFPSFLPDLVYAQPFSA